MAFESPTKPFPFNKMCLNLMHSRAQCSSLSLMEQDSCTMSLEMLSRRDLRRRRRSTCRARRRIRRCSTLTTGSRSRSDSAYAPRWSARTSWTLAPRWRVWTTSTFPATRIDSISSRSTLTKRDSHRWRWANERDISKKLGLKLSISIINSMHHISLIIAY